MDARANNLEAELLSAIYELPERFSRKTLPASIRLLRKITDMTIELHLLESRRAVEQKKAREAKP